MAETLIEQFNQAVDALVASGAAVPRVAEELEPLVALATELRELPRDDFKASLKADLMRRAAMSSEAATTPAKEVSYIREGFHTITPYLAVHEVHELIQFVKDTFAAEGSIYGVGSEGGLHSEYKIGDSMVMIGGGAAWQGTAKLTALHVYVDDVDETYEKAIAAGAKSMNGPIEANGERVAGVKDVSGNEWYFAKRLSGSHTDEGLRTVNVYLHPVGADKMMDFLKQSFGAEEIVSHRATPDGPVLHAKLKIGDSVLEMGEAHGPYQPLSTMLFLYVDDVDAWHQRAVSGGAKAVDEPKDQPYGDRVSSVTDPFGNLWYLATHITDSA